MGHIHHGVARDKSDTILDRTGPPAAAAATAILSQPWGAWGREFMMHLFSFLAPTDLLEMIQTG